ncbi:hypothetical protein [Helicobacter sp. MIT 99-5507]|uniref:hypothetical protein n=1 Tax=Helicobacter sp. MIT 99-5507 TaxID=152489 RepID=UPI000E1ECF0A|nr:hypothetical protein [Helicobacter sp. MIT 99-5507]RDU57449.1 hypothetical protein CQA42_05870 [Helicobacter sp. MIT 99-5507]
MNQFQVQVYEQLDKLDEYLSSKNQSERLLLGTLVGIALAGIVYFILFDLSTNIKLNKNDIYNEILTKVTEEQGYIDSMENGGFYALEQRIRTSQEEIAQANSELELLKKLREEIFVYSKDWFLTFDDASKAATAMGLIVNGTDIAMSGENETLGGMRYSSFNLFGHGRFSSILKYMDWLETYGKFISIDSVIIESKDNRLNFSIAIRNFRGGA